MGQLHCHDLNKQCCCSEQDILPSYSIPGIENRKFGNIRLYWHAYYILFYYTLQILRFFFFLQIESLLQPSIKQVHQCQFSNSVGSFCVSVSHFGNFHNTSNPPPAK